MRKKNLIIIALGAAMICIYGIFTWQLLLAAELFTMGVLIILYIHLSSGTQDLIKVSWAAIISGAIAAILLTLAQAQFLLWVVPIVAAFSIMRSFRKITSHNELSESE